MSRIQKVHALQVLDSRGNPTVETHVFTTDGVFSAMVPSGASTGIHEALELRDNKEDYHGKSVKKAVANINKTIGPKLKGKDPCMQLEIDDWMNKLDGTQTKSKLGANAILGVSMAVFRAGAGACQLPLYRYAGKVAGQRHFCLPVPQMNVLNGGEHAGLKNDVQETMIVPWKFKNHSSALQAGTETYHELKNLLKTKFGPQGILIGDEGGFVPPVKTVEERLDLLQKAVEKAGYDGHISIAMDAAASEFYKKGTYTIGKKTFKTPLALTNYYEKLATDYPIVSIEDGFSQDDWNGWSVFHETMGEKMQLVGDDLLVTNIERIREALDHDACNALLLKVNQIGSISESIHAWNLCISNDWNVVVSHRSGETEDNLIADLVVGLGTGQSKFGAPARTDRNAKYNQLLRIEEELGPKADFGV